MNDLKRERTLKEKIYIALSSYATHKDYTFSEWLQCKEDVKDTRAYIDLINKGDGVRIV